MSGAARAIERKSVRYKTAREPWGIRPEYKLDGTTPYPLNTHRPRYNTHAQDPLARRPGPAAMMQVFLDKSKLFDQNRRILNEGSHTNLALWVGDLINGLNPGQGDLASEPIPRSTIRYWIRVLMRLHLIERWDSSSNTPAGPRRRGDGRHKTTWIVNHYDRALDLILADPDIAIPVNRTFWTLDGRPMSTAEVVAWKLDAAVAQRMPEAWENNARFHDPNAPMKPLRRTERAKRPATEEEVARIHQELVGKWQIAATIEQAAEILRWAREKHAISAGALAAAMSSTIENRIALDRKTRQPSVFTVGFFNRDRIRGLAEVWRSNQLRQEADAARKARREAEYSGNDPPG